MIPHPVTKNNITLKTEKDLAILTLKQVNMLEILPTLKSYVNTIIESPEQHIALILFQNSSSADFSLPLKEIQKAYSKEKWEGYMEELSHLFHTIQKSNVSWISAIHGACFGFCGQLALSCDYRLASFHSSTYFGFLETSFGFLPAGSACLRLPNLIGVQKALDMILNSKQISARWAKTIGLVHQVVHPSDLEPAGRKWASQIQQGLRTAKPPQKRTSLSLLDRVYEIPFCRQILYYKTKKQILKDLKGFYPAPLTALELIKNTYPSKLFEQADLKAESDAFCELVVSPVAQHLTALHNSIQELKNKQTNTGVKDPKNLIKKVAVIGAGTMGGGIAHWLAYNNIPVLLKDIHAPSLSASLKYIYSSFVTQKKLLAYIRPVFELSFKTKARLPTPHGAGHASLLKPLINWFKSLRFVRSESRSHRNDNSLGNPPSPGQKLNRLKGGLGRLASSLIPIIKEPNSIFDDPKGNKLSAKGEIGGQAWPKTISWKDSPFQKLLPKKIITLTAEEQKNCFSKIRPQMDHSGFQKVDLVIETVVEDLEIKKQVIAKSSAKANPLSLFAANTSSFKISELAKAHPKKDRFLGLHFFYPAGKSPLVEVIVPQNQKTDITDICEWIWQNGKVPFVVKDSPGFLVLRLFLPLISEAIYAVQSGLRIPQVDEVYESFGFRVGPFRLMDELGLDILSKLIKAFEREGQPCTMPKETAYLNPGFLGKKNKIGFYIYNDKRKILSVNNQMYKDLRAKFLSPSNPEDILERGLYRMINQAAVTLEEQVVQTQKELDLALILGLGFPAFRGGLLKYADWLSLKTVVAGLTHFAHKWGDRFQTSSALLKRTETGKGFYND